MKKILLVLLTSTSISVFAQVGSSVNVIQDYQKVKMYNSTKDNVCIWQGSTPFPIKDVAHYNEVLNMTVYYKQSDKGDWKEIPYFEVKNLKGDANSVVSCQTPTKEGVLSYRSHGGDITFSDVTTNSTLTLNEAPPKNTNPLKGDNLVTYSLSDEDEQKINGKDVVCTINGTGTVIDYTKETIMLICENK